MHAAVEEAAAHRRLRTVCPVVATAKDEGLCDASFATLLIRVSALHQSTVTFAIRELHRKIMDESAPNLTERDAALGQILVMQGAYLSAPFPLPAEFTNSTVPCPLRSISTEEAILRQKLRKSCPVVAAIKELGLCEETTYALLVTRSKKLMSSQHHSQEFNLCIRVMDEGIADKQRDQALGELLLKHGGYFSLALFRSNMLNAIYYRWKDEKCKLKCTAPSERMQLYRRRGDGQPLTLF
jgi:hypothetical protein